jgi:hypothetical protein
MAKKSRRAQRRKSQRRKRGLALTPIDQMNKAMGEFLTAQGRVELTMILLLMMIRDEDYEWLFDEMSKRTFGQKIVFFKLYTSDDEAFSLENLFLRDQIFKDLDELLPRRNSIVHGETYEDEIGGRPKQPYRVGVIKKNVRYLEDYSMAKQGPNVFTIQQVRDATALCNRTWKSINKIRGIEKSLWWD